MKIVYIYPIFIHLAGTERVFTDKMNYLADKMGYDVTLLTYEQGDHPFPFPLSSKVKHVDLDARFFTLYRYTRIVRWFKEWRLSQSLRQRFNGIMIEMSPDIVIAPTYYPNVLSMIAQCPTKFFKILESHIDKRFILINESWRNKNIFQIVRSAYHTFIENRASKHFDILVALNPEDADDWARYVKTIVIPNVAHLQDEGKCSYLINKRVIFAGRLIEQKGVFDLLKIWSIVYAKHPDWQLDIYGDGELRDELEKRIDKMNIGVKLHLPTAKIMDKFCDSSIFVLSSIFEPFGLVIVEAMSCGLPVVSFDCPYGPSGIISDGKDGFLIPNRDVQLFADRVCELIESYDLRKKMGAQGAKSSQRYSAEKIMPQWIHLFENIISSDGRNNQN